MSVVTGVTAGNVSGVNVSHDVFRAGVNPGVNVSRQVLRTYLT